MTTPGFLSTSHEATEDVQVVEEVQVEEEEEYDTDSDAEYPFADNYEVDSLNDLLFLRAVTTRTGRMVRVVHREWFGYVISDKQPLFSL